MRYLFFITSFFLPVAATAQPRLYEGHVVNGMNVFSLGDPMSKYDSLVTCAGAQPARGAIVAKRDSNCFVFRFLPAETDSICIGTVRFPTVVLSSSFRGKLDNVLFIASYGKDKASRADADYKSIVAYLNTIFPAPVPYTGQTSSYHAKQGWTWTKDNIRYSLVLTQYYDASKQTLPGLEYAIDFYYVQVKKKQ